MFVIGVTGGVGTGKSTVARMFERLGAVVLDADAIVHELMEPKRPAWREIVRAFGAKVLNTDGTINRAKLAAIVFRDAPRRTRLERLLHPRVMAHLARELRRLRRSRRIPAVVLDVPLLLEAGGRKLVDTLVVVTAPPNIQRTRLHDTHGWTDEESNARIRAQWDLAAKVAVADHVVDNARGVDATQTQVTRIWKQLGQRTKSSSTSQRSKS